jgi:threonyl-tRNA synthetase
MKITFPDNNVREYSEGTTGMEIAKSISEGLARVALGIYVDEVPYDLSRPITQDSKIRLVTFDNEEGKSIFWHSSAHLMAEAIESLYPGTKFGIGPSIEHGFYYDIDTVGDRKISLEDLPLIEKKMVELSKKNSEFKRIEITWQEAVDYFKEKGDEYKLELLESFKDQEITFYQQGDFTDLCRGTHIPHTGHIKAIKLLSVAGAYWRGDATRGQMTRIYGITFPKNAQLEEFIRLREEAERRDHRRLGKELELFAFSTKVGQGLPLWLPKGAVVRNLLENYMRSIQRDNMYKHVITPHIGQKELYVTSGHYAKYGADSFQPINTPAEGEEFLLKPMNCPHHCEIYASKPRSYKELPLRLAEFGTVYRYEMSGELHGLTRVRGFTQDDAHLFCTQDQIKDEFKRVIRIIQKVFSELGFDDYIPQVSLRDPENKEKYIGSDEVWEKAERAIIEATEEMNMETVVEYGEAAFYGPKLDFMVRDAIGRKWQLGTIQVDYNLPERFELEYIGADNHTHRPVMIHQAPFGSMERFMAILIEHYAGNFPYWLAPVQISVLPITDKQIEYANQVVTKLKDEGFRVELDDRAEKVNRKIAESEQAKIPFALILGQKEADNWTVSVREHTKGDIGVKTIGEIIDLFKFLNKPGNKHEDYKPHEYKHH